MKTNRPGWLDDDTFEFWVPAQAVVVKSKTSKARDGSVDTDRRWLQGIASTDSRDLQGEIVEQKGIDFSYFLKYGYFNNDHKAGFENKVGEPTEVKLTKNGLWVKGFLYNSHKIADDIWELMHAQAASGSKRRVGFSIQGKVKRREESMIKECWIQDIAVTPCPVNTTTWAEVAKSLSAQQWDFNKSTSSDDEEDEEKALGAGNVMVPESLEGKKKDTRTADGMDKSLTFEESVAWIQTKTGMPRANAEATARVVFNLYDKENQ